MTALEYSCIVSLISGVLGFLENLEMDVLLVDLSNRLLE